MGRLGRSFPQSTGYLGAGIGDGGGPQTVNASVVDALALAGAATRLGAFARTETDALGLVSAVDVLKLTVRAVADALGLAGAAGRATGALRTAVDALGHGNAVVRQSAMRSGWREPQLDRRRPFGQARTR
jgi:hypothetical protein